MPFIFSSLSPPSSVSGPMDATMNTKFTPGKLGIDAASWRPVYIRPQQPLMTGKREAHKKLAIVEEGISAATQNTLTKFGTASLLELLKDPLTFVPATNLTLKDEMVVLRKQSLLENRCTVHRRRRRQLNSLPKSKLSSKTDFYGFPNPGNLCYRRSIFQSLVHVSKVHEYLRNHKDRYHYHAHDKIEGCLLCTFLAVSATSRSGLPSLKSKMDENIGRLDRALRQADPTRLFDWVHDNEQADAHDVLLFVVQKLEERFNLPQGIIESLFKSCISSSWKCENCGETSTAGPVEETSLQVSINPSNNKRKRKREPSTPLEHCLRQYFNDKAPDVKCEACGNISTRERKLEIEAAPEALFIQLKRFRHIEHDRTEKITTPVAVPRFLHLSEYAKEPPQARDHAAFTYRLQSVVAHRGNLEFGHYIAYAQRGGTVWKFDDAVASRASLREMLDPTVNGEGEVTGFTPYILTYVSCEGIPEEE